MNFDLPNSKRAIRRVGALMNLRRAIRLNTPINIEPGVFHKVSPHSRTIFSGIKLVEKKDTVITFYCSNDWKTYFVRCIPEENGDVCLPWGNIYLNEAIFSEIGFKIEGPTSVKILVPNKLLFDAKRVDETRYQKGYFIPKMFHEFSVTRVDSMFSI